MALPLEKLGTTYEERVGVDDDQTSRDDVTTSLWRASACEATSNGDVVRLNGWAEVED